MPSSLPLAQQSPNLKKTPASRRPGILEGDGWVNWSALATLLTAIGDSIRQRVDQLLACVLASELARHGLPPVYRSHETSC
jgi:hypothetical protein